MRAAKMASWVVLCTVAGCADLPTVDESVCGNRVVEPALGEQCDRVANCGEPGSVNACRFVCAFADDCPDGWACGSDGVCREPTGTYAPSTVNPLAGQRTVAADFDGDGAVDLMGQAVSSLVVRFGDADGTFAAASHLQLPFGTGIATPIDGNGDDALDLVVAFGEAGLTLFTGDGNRGFTPQAQALFDLGTGEVPCKSDEAVAIQGAADLPEQLLLLKDGSTLQFLDAPAACAGHEADCAFDEYEGILRRTVVRGHLEGVATNQVWPAEQFTIPAVGLRYLPIWGVNKYDPDTNLEQELRPVRLATVPLPDRLGAGDLVRFGDFDFDGCPDIFLYRSPVGGAGAGHYDLFKGDDGSGGCGAPSSYATRVEFDNYHLLNTVKLDSGGDVLVLWRAASELGPFEIAISAFPEAINPAPPFGVALLRSTPTDVQVLDYNGDGARDLALIADEGLVTFFLNYDSLGFNPFAVEIGSPASQMIVGDFDGDLFDDVAAVVPDPTGLSSDDRVYIVYGEPDGSPSAAQSIGDFGASAHIDLIDSSIDSLIVVSKPDAGATTCRNPLSLVIGDTARQMVAPFAVLHVTDGGQPASVIDVALVIDVTPTDGASEVAALGVASSTDDEAARVLAVGSVTVADGTFTSTGSKALAANLALFRTGALRLATGQLDGDAEPEVVAVSRQDVADDERFMVMDLSTSAVDVAPLPLAIHGPIAIELADLDADGDLDAVGLSAGSVLWSIPNVDGALDASQARAIQVGDAVVGGATCIDLAVLHGTPGETAVVALTCYGGGTSIVLLASIDPASGALAEASSFATTLAPGRIEAADFTGDGLEDIAVLSGTAVELFRQCSSIDQDCFAPDAL